MIVADYDNTLANKKRVVTEATKNTIKKYLDCGGKFIICTSRPYAAIKQIAKNLGLNEEIIVNQGASIRRLSDDETLYDLTLNVSEVKEILSFVEADCANVFLANDESVYAKRKNIFARVCLYKMRLQDKHQIDVFDDTNINDIRVNQIIVGSYHPKKIKQLEERLNHLLGDRYSIGISDRFLLYIAPLSVDKGKAIKIIADMYNFEKKDIISFGDSIGDKEMFAYSAKGIAMGNASIQLKKIADDVCGNAFKDGLEEYVRKNCL